MHTYIRSVLSFHAQWTDTPQAQALNQSTAVHLLHCTKQHRSDSKLITVQTATCAVPVLIVSLIIALKSLWSNVRFACNEVQRRSLYIQVYLNSRKHVKVGCMESAFLLQNTFIIKRESLSKEMDTESHINYLSRLLSEL